MCGVAAFFAYHYASPGVVRDELRAACDAQVHRGPDGRGEWVSSDGRAALGHRRLSILDLSESGSQPMPSSDGALVLSFNGEIYNFRELRSDLEKKGRVFKSGTDTEVLLQLYAEKGEGMFAELRGMYAFALWDEKKKAMLLARDPLGVKPLYYADDGWTLRAASETRALLAAGVSRSRDAAAAAGFFLWGSIPEPLTLYREIRQVPAGSYLWIDAAGPRPPKTYFSVARVFHDASPKDFDGQAFREALLDSVRHHFVSDVPVGIFLSSGIDSSALTAFAREAGVRDLQTLTLCFRELKGTPQDEGVQAEETAALYHTRHVETRIGLSEAKALLPDFFRAMDQPSIDGLNTWLVSLMASRENLKVVLSGLGADELFGGYPSFADVPSWARRMKAWQAFPPAGKLARKILSAFSAARPKAAGLPEYGGTYEGAYFLKRGLFMPWELPALLGDEAAEEGMRRLRLLEGPRRALDPDPGTPFGRVSALEMSLYMRNQLLRDADWAGMAHSLEIRVPFVDARLLTALAPMLVKGGRDFKKELAAAVRPALPAAVVSRPKTGFFVPLDRWLDEDPQLSSWKKSPLLSRPQCHWSRRWAYEVYRRIEA